MARRVSTDVSYDPYDVEIFLDPYPVYKRLRDEAPLYYNEEHDFYALSRFADVERCFVDSETFISSHGVILEQIKSGLEWPKGFFILEDDPLHAAHRSILSRVFTPKRVAELEPRVREFCAQIMDPLVGAGRFDFVADIAGPVPMKVISMLLGIPDEDQEAVRVRAEDTLRTEPGKPMAYSEDNDLMGMDMFGDYVDWRAENPSDDLMTDLLTVEFADETGATRRLTRDEVLTYTWLLAAAGNETTGRLIGTAAKVLADHPDQRRELVDDRALIANAVEELLRFEGPSLQTGRYVARDVELHGRIVPEGSAVLLLEAAANRDERVWPDAERFDIHRSVGKSVALGYGAHYCLGASLARLEARVVLDEVLDRFPTWDVDLEHARMATTTTVRGWETLPVVVA